MAQLRTIRLYFRLQARDTSLHAELLDGLDRGVLILSGQDMEVLLHSEALEKTPETTKNKLHRPGCKCDGNTAILVTHA